MVQTGDAEAERGWALQGERSRDQDGDTLPSTVQGSTSIKQQKKTLRCSVEAVAKTQQE